MLSSISLGVVNLKALLCPSLNHAKESRDKVFAHEYKRPRTGTETGSEENEQCPTVDESTTPHRRVFSHVFPSSESE